MNKYTRAIIAFLAAAAMQAIGFPLISWIFGFGDRLHAPSWIVIVLVSAIVAVAALAGTKSSPN